MENELLDFDRFGAWLLERKLSIGVAPNDSMGNVFQIYYDSRRVGQGQTLATAIRDAQKVTFVPET